MNLFQNIISPELASAIGETFMHSLWQIAAIGVLLLVTLLFVRRSASVTRYRLGAGAMVLMFALPVITFLSVYHPAEANAMASNLEANNGGIGFAFFPAGELSGETILEQVQTFFNNNGFLVMALWLLGTLFFSLRLAGSYLQVRNLRRRYTSPVPAEMQATLARLVKRMGIRRKVTLLQSSSVSTPMVMGALKPVILVPLGLATGLNSDQIECLLAHELAHVRRMDYVVNVLQSIVEIVLFFHPVIWWVSKMVREERENCCDQAVIEVKENRITYARALLNLEAIRNTQPELAMASTGGKLFQRIQRITGQESVEKGSYSRGIFLGLLSLFLVLVLSTTSTETAKAVNPLGNLLPPEIQFDRDQQGNVVVLDEDGEEEESSEEADLLAAEMDEDAMEEEFIVERHECKNTCEGDHSDNLNLSRFISDNLSNIMDGIPLGKFKAQFANYHHADQDSPITAIVIIEDGKEVRIRMDRNGKVVAATKDGRSVDDDELDRYQDIVDDSFYQYAGRSGRRAPKPVPPMPDMSGMPRIPPMPDMSDMPSAPGVGNMPPMPPMPDMKNMPQPPAAPEPQGKNESDNDYERRMAKYENKMEKWGEEFEEAMESQDWDEYEEEMEAWGEKFGAQFENGDWEKWGRKMEKWGEKIEAQFENQDWSKFEKDMEKWGEEFAEQFDEEQWEEFGEQMEEWAEKFGSELEVELEGMARKLEREVEELERHSHEREREAREMERELERQSREWERNGNDMSNGIDRLKNELDNDNLVDEGDSFRLRINDEDLIINGDKQSKGTHAKYRRMIESMDIPVEGEEFIEINFKRGKSQIKH